MLLPLPEAQALLPRFQKDGLVELPGASVERAGKAAIVTQKHPRFLNAEDETTLNAAEVCVDLALLDREQSKSPSCAAALVEHPKYKGRRVFGAGINLTHLYRGRIPFVFYLQRDLGYVNKIYRGLAVADDPPPDEFGGRSIEKPWVAAVETFAIGGHCQLLLVMDYVLAETRRLSHLAGAQGGHHPGRRQHAAAALHRRPPRAPGDPVRTPAGVRQSRRAD